MVDVVKVVEAKAVDAPPPPPPPPPKDLPPPPKNLPPPPVYVPPPPVDVPPPPIAPQITTTPNLPPPAPEPRIQPQAPVAPVATPVTARPAKFNANDPACKPEYPPAAVRAGATGVTKMRFVVDATGKVTSAEIVGSSGPTREHRLLDNAAKSTIAACPFTPGVDAEGHPTGTTVPVEYVWKLE
ncbi:MAG: energy transducer TonB [Burkholderiales bacterium]|nr:energy transducer TonB [Burkholderiales bacterium]